MRTFSYIEAYKQVLTPKVVSLVTCIHEYKGAQQRFINEYDKDLQTFKCVTLYDACKYSNAIENITISDQRLHMLLHQECLPETRNEEQMLGYYKVLESMDEYHELISLQPAMLQQLHQDLYQFSEVQGGNYKTADNIIMEKHLDGSQTIRFYPTPSEEVKDAMLAVCYAYHQGINEGYDPLILIPMFLLDFLCIHPFMDGNGRISRLVTMFLLQQHHYDSLWYISLDQAFEHRKDLYYETLHASSVHWHTEANDYEPFVTFFLEMVLKTYRTFQDRIITPKKEVPSKHARIAYVIKNHLGKISKQELMRTCPDISETTIQRTLHALVRENKVIQICKGRYACYVWNHNQ